MDSGHLVAPRSLCHIYTRIRERRFGICKRWGAAVRCSSVSSLIALSCDEAYLTVRVNIVARDSDVIVGHSIRMAADSGAR